MDTKPVINKLATTSLGLGILGWLFYILQWCFDVTIGLLLALFTAGMSAICATVLDFLPVTIWGAGILAGHVAYRQIKHTGVPGRSRAVWGLVLSYMGMFFSIIFFVVIVVLIAAGIGGGILEKILPALPRN